MIFLDYNKKWNVAINFNKNPKYVIKKKSFEGVALFHADRRKDGHT